MSDIFQWVQAINFIFSRVPLSLSWGGKTISLDVHWFQYESDPSRNSNVYQVANKVVSDQFPGEFGSERLVQQVVDHILRVTENRNGIKQVSGHHPTQDSKNQPNATSGMSSSCIIFVFNSMCPLIFTGRNGGACLKDDSNWTKITYSP